MQAEQKIKEFTHEDIWRISVVFESIHVFYQTDAQLAEHSLDGTNEMIDAAITTIVKPYDKYDIFPKELHCTFTSKQTLDEQYDGSMYFYLL